MVLLATGCGRRTVPVAPTAADGGGDGLAVAAGVTLYQTPGTAPSGSAWTLDVDLAEPGTTIGIVAGRRQVLRGRAYARSRTAADWCRETGAVGCINGGYFGDRKGDLRQIVGLLLEDGVLRSPGKRQTGRKGVRYAKSTLGVDLRGRPDIRWAASRQGGGATLDSYDHAVDGRARTWRPRSAVMCGPRLVASGEAQVCDRSERLVSPGRLPRTFVGYSTERGRPRFVALVVAQTMTYEDAASYIQAHFQSRHGVNCAEAMCLDGGGSTQMAYAQPSGIAEAFPTLTPVPTAIIVRSSTR